MSKGSDSKGTNLLKAGKTSEEPSHKPMFSKVLTYLEQSAIIAI